MLSRRRAALLAAPVAAALIVAGVPSAFGQSTGRSGKALAAVMTGTKELKKNNRPGGGQAGARGGFTAVIRGTQVCYGLSVSGIGKPLAAHIHKAPRNRSGDIVLPLTSIPTSGNPGSAAACVTAPRSLARDLLKHPSRYYVNVHTQRFPAGAIRGQLSARSS
jgi:CHRD domain-containing protein